MLLCKYKLGFILCQQTMKRAKSCDKEIVSDLVECSANNLLCSHQNSVCTCVREEYIILGVPSTYQKVI